MEVELTTHGRSFAVRISIYLPNTGHSVGSRDTPNIEIGKLSRPASNGRLDTVTNGRYQELEFNGSFSAMNRKSGRSTPDPLRSITPSD
jgi:hypothetical protein